MAILRFFVVSAVALLVLCAQIVALGAQEIKVGIVDSYSGPPSTYTNDVRDAFKLALDKINRSRYPRRFEHSEIAKL